MGERRDDIHTEHPLDPPSNNPSTHATHEPTPISQGTSSLPLAGRRIEAPVTTLNYEGGEVPSVPISRVPHLPSSSVVTRNGNDEMFNRFKGFLAGTKYGASEPTCGSVGQIVAHTNTNRNGEEDIGAGQEESSGGQGSSSAVSRGREQRKVYNYVERIPGSRPGEKTRYRCKRCVEPVGQRNATRFTKHCMECDLIETPVKIELALDTKSKSIGMPRSRSNASRAIERANGSSTERDGDSDCDQASEGKRKNSDTMESGISKRLKFGTQAPPSLTREYVNEVAEAAMELVVEAGLPFSIFDKKDGDVSAYTRFLRKVYPELAAKYLPTSHLLGGTLLEKFYERTKASVKKNITEALEEGFATVVFDGWDDVNSAPVVNVLLKMEPSIHTGGKEFFLRSVYTGSKTTGASEYVKIIEDVMKDYGGLGNICAITSDNTSCCLNARKAVTEKYPGIVGVNDQSHVADLLIEDVCKIQWISDIVSKVCDITRDLHAHRKMKERFKTMLVDYNNRVQSFESAQSGGESLGLPKSDRYIGNFCKDRDPAQAFEGVGTFRVRTAIMPLQRSNTRFASSEGVLDSFLRSVYALRGLVSEEDFYSTLYKPKNAAHRKQINDNFCVPIKDPQFERSVREIHTILCLLRRYLRVFDSNDARISEVFPFTVELEKRLKALPLTTFLTPGRKSELMTVFHVRKDGPAGSRVKVRLLEDVHYAAFLLDPNQASMNPKKWISRFRAHARRYAASKGAINVEGWVEKLTFSYISEVSAWGADRCGVEGRANIAVYKGNPLVYWNFAYEQNPDLREFACRTLSCSPTSCAVERSFSAQKRLHPKERNRLAKEKVQKLMFCQWNVKLQRKLDSFNKNSFRESINQVMSMVTDASDPANTEALPSTDEPTTEKGNMEDADMENESDLEEMEHGL